jgi:hypothetical protein
MAEQPFTGMERQMKRLVLIVLLLAGSAMGAHADNDIYNNILK